MKNNFLMSFNAKKKIAYLTELIIATVCIFMLEGVDLYPTIFFSLFITYLLITFILYEISKIFFDAPEKSYFWIFLNILLFNAISSLKISYFGEALKAQDISIIFSLKNFDLPLISKKIYIFFLMTFIFYLINIAFFIYRLIKNHLSNNIKKNIRLLLSLAFFISTYPSFIGNKFGLFLSIQDGKIHYFINSLFIKEIKPNFTHSTQPFKNELATLKEQENLLSHNKKQKPNIIIWLHESTINPSILCAYKNFPQLSLFKKNIYTKELGWMRVHTYGGGTWLSEFSLLSGLNSYDFEPSRQLVYYITTQHLNDSFVKNLKKSGYHTIALTPQLYKNFYNAETAYKQLGFDEVISSKELIESPKKWHVSDDNVQKSIAIIQKKYNNQPIFIFALSIHQHAPYKDNFPKINWHGSLEEAFSPKEAILQSRLQDYWDRLLSLSNAMESLENTVLLSSKTPTILASFGDHHPDFEADRLFEEKKWSQKSFCHTSGIDNPDYVTYYKIQDNFSLTATQLNTFNNDEVVDITFLGERLLQYANIPMSPLFKANYALDKACHGKMNNCSKKALLNSYKSYIYNELNIYQ